MRYLLQTWYGVIYDNFKQICRDFLDSDHKISKSFIRNVIENERNIFMKFYSNF